jgi:DNA-binding MarR family transcriptional regulator
VLHAYAQSIQSVFTWSVPVAVAAFALTWFLRENPLRSTSTASDLGQGLGGAPTERSSRHEIERALSQLMRRDARAEEMYARLGTLAGVDLPPGGMWALCRVARDGSVGGADLADRADVTVEQGRPYTDRLVAAGLVDRRDGTLEITDSGRAVADRLFETRREALGRLLDGWQPDDHPELAALLRRLAREDLGNAGDRALIGQRRSDDGSPTLTDL